MFANTTPTRTGHYHKVSDEGPKGTSMAGLWLVFYGLIIGVAVLGKAGAELGDRSGLQLSQVKPGNQGLAGAPSVVAVQHLHQLRHIVDHEGAPPL